MIWDDGEICRSYRMAKNRRKQIGILADLNETSPSKIIKILEDNMEIKKWTEQDNMKLLDMAAAGMAQKDLAAHYSTTVGNISWRLKHLRDKMKPTDTDAKIAEICEIPDPPKKKIDYTDSLLETLREAIELHEPVYFVTDSQEPPKPEPKPRALFTELHSVLYTAEATAKRNGMTATRLSVDVDGGKIHIRAWDETDNEIYICKKYQPVTEENDRYSNNV